MYLVLVYIIIAFIYIMLPNTSNKKHSAQAQIEGNTLESYNYLEFQPMTNDDIINEQLKNHLNKYSDDMNQILKDTLDENKENQIIKSQIDSGKADENILYDIYIRDALGEKKLEEYDDESYNNYIDNYVKFNDKQTGQMYNVPFTGDQQQLKKNIYPRKIMYSNEQDYVDTKYYENILKENKGKGKDLKMLAPGLIDRSNGNVINNVIDIKKYYDEAAQESNASGIEIKGAEFCCDYSMLNIVNVPPHAVLPLISKEEEDKVNERMRDLNSEDVEENDDGVYGSNYPYYDYMKDGDLIFEPLLLNYNKSKNIGSINL